MNEHTSVALAFLAAAVVTLIVTACAPAGRSATHPTSEVTVVAGDGSAA
jgi:hypothetical protein